jgi:glycosyltransferase involved in cell wall biosynthesis
MNIHGIGCISGFMGGFSTHTINFFKSLSKITNLEITNIPFLKPLSEWSTDRYSADAHILLSYPKYLAFFSNDKFEGRKITYTVFEQTNLNNHPKLDTGDELWTASKWGQNILKNHGIESKVVPEGVDPEIFNPTREPQPALEQFDVFKFLCIARSDPRKNLDVLIKAFLEEFKYDNDVALVMENLNINTQLYRDKKIIYINSSKRHEPLGRLYASCDAFVFPTKAEGWGLPVCEAMACGLPTIVTGYSAITDFADNSNAYIIEHTMEDMKDEWGTDGTWANPDVMHLRHLMRHVYENREEAKEKGKIASKHILSNFTWEHAAKKALELLSLGTTGETENN